MKPIELTHSTWKTELGSPVKVFIYPQHIFAVLYMPENKCTAVQAAQGAYQTVLESEEEVNKKIEEALNKQGE